MSAQMCAPEGEMGFVFPGTEDLNPHEVFAGPGYQAPLPRTDMRAVCALLAGLMSWMPLVGVVAVALGLWALRRGQPGAGVSCAWAGVVLGGVSLVVWLWVVLLLLW